MASSGAALYEACAKGYRQKVESLLSENKCICEYRGKDGNTILHAACESGHLEIVQLLLQVDTSKFFDVGRLIDVNALNNEKESSLHIVSRKGDIKLCKLLLEDPNCNSNLKNVDGDTPLHIACKKNHLEIVQSLLNSCNPNLQNNISDTPIHIAVNCKYEMVCEELLMCKACKPDFQDCSGNTVFHIAAAKGSIEVCRLLFSKTEYLNIKNREQQTPLHVAILQRNIQTIKLLVNNKQCELNHEDNDGFTPLHIAALQNDILCIKLLMDQRTCDPNYQDKKGFTPLHVAVRQKECNIGLVQLLVNDQRCKLNLQDTDLGNTPLLTAVEFNPKVCIDMLETGQADVTVQNRKGWTLLHFAASLGNEKIVQYLSGDNMKDCNPNHKDRDGNTPLHVAVLKGFSVQLCKHIMNFRNCDVSISNLQGHTPLHHAIIHNRPIEVVQVLLNGSYCNPNIQDKDGNTPLHTAVRKESSEICRCIIGHKECALDVKNYDDMAVLHIAVKLKNEELVMMLLESQKCDVNSRDKHQYTPLHKAVEKDSLNICKALMRMKECDINGQAQTGSTPLHLAARYMYPEIFLYIIRDERCKPNLQDNINKYTALHHIVENWDKAETEDAATQLQLLESLVYCDPSIQDKLGKTPMHTAVEKGSVKLCKCIMSIQGCNLNVQDNSRSTPLHIAIETKKHEIVKIIAEDERTKPNIGGYLGNTPLHIAANIGNVNFCKLVLAINDCNPNICNRDQQTPLHIAVIGEQTEVVKVLLENEMCDPKIQNKMGDTPLHVAAKNKSIEICELILANVKSKVDIHNGDGWTPLHIALQDQKCKNAELTDSEIETEMNMAKLFLSREDCNINVKRKSYPDIEKPTNGYAALHIATERENSSVIQILTSTSQCDVNIQDNEDNTPLHIATERENISVIKILTSISRCDLNIKDKEGNTPLHIAAKKGNIMLCESTMHRTACSATNAHGYTPLHIATATAHLERDLEVVKYFVRSQNCSLYTTAINGETPLHIAAKKGNKELCEVVSDTCLDREDYCLLNIQNEEGNTALHLSIKECQANVATFLAKKLIEEKKVSGLKIKNSNGNTPIHLACQHANDSGILAFARWLISESDIANDLLDTNKEGKIPMELTNSYNLMQEISHITECKTQHCVQTYIKLFIMGNIESGKSTLMKAICKEESRSWWKKIFFPSLFRRVGDVPPHTAGIIPTTFRSKVFGNTIIYDTAGHPEFYSSHIAVLQNTSAPAVFLVTADLSKSIKDIITETKFWWDFIDGQCNVQHHVILVGSHTDIVQSSGESAREKMSQLLAELKSLKPTFNFVKEVFMDCRDYASKGLFELTNLLNSSCMNLRRTADIELHCHALYAFLQDHFQDHVVCTVSDIATKISESNKLLPNNPAKLTQLISSLSKRGLVLLIERSKSEKNPIVILNQKAILEEINGTVFAPENFRQHSFNVSTGVIPFSKIREVFTKYNPDSIAGYLEHFEYCFKIEDEETLQKIQGEHLHRATEPPISLKDDRYYFFPALVRVDRPNFVCHPENHTGRDTEKDYSCWFYSCTENKYLTSRFLHVLLLRLALFYTLAVNPQDKPNSPTFCRRCSIWKCGIHWHDRQGNETIVEVDIQGRWAIVLMRYSVTPVKELDQAKVTYAKLRSDIIGNVRSVKEEFCPKIQMSESFIHPLQIRYPFVPAENLSRYSLADIASAIKKDEMYAIDQVGQKPIEIETLLLFEPYYGFGSELLNELFRDSNTEVNNDFITTLAYRNHMYTRLPLYVEAVSPLPSIASFNANTKDKTQPEQCKALFKVLLNRMPEPRSYKQLYSWLDTFSIFGGRDHW